MDGFVQLIASAECIKPKLIELQQENAKVGLKVQPKIFKMEHFTDEKYAVVYKDYYFAFNDILLAIDCCLKLCFVFNVQYPFKALRFWKFVAHFFYNMNTDDVDVISLTKEFKIYQKGY